MDTYHPDELYAAVADELFISRKKATATGGRNNRAYPVNADTYYM